MLLYSYYRLYHNRMPHTKKHSGARFLNNRYRCQQWNWTYPTRCNIIWFKVIVVSIPINTITLGLDSIKRLIHSVAYCSTAGIGNDYVPANIFHSTKLPIPLPAILLIKLSPLGRLATQTVLWWMSSVPRQSCLTAGELGARSVASWKTALTRSDEITR